jgi:prepilin-type N-terminal cleavage/methylation domain-containing protein
MNKKSGFTLVEIMIVVAIIGLLAAIAIPSFVKARNQSQTNACINNLRQMDAAKEQWALETGAADAAIVDTALTGVVSYIKGEVTPDCPASGTLSWEVIGVNPKCTLSANGHVLKLSDGTAAL